MESEVSSSPGCISATHTRLEIALDSSKSDTAALFSADKNYESPVSLDSPEYFPWTMGKNHFDVVLPTCPRSPLPPIHHHRHRMQSFNCPCSVLGDPRSQLQNKGSKSCSAQPQAPFWLCFAGYEKLRPMDNDALLIGPCWRSSISSQARLSPYLLLTGHVQAHETLIRDLMPSLGSGTQIGLH